MREARRLALCQRAAKIGAAKKNAAAKEKREIRAELEGLRGSPGWADPDIDTPKVVIQGQVRALDAFSKGNLKIKSGFSGLPPFLMDLCLVTPPLGTSFVLI